MEMGRDYKWTQRFFLGQGKYSKINWCDSYKNIHLIVHLKPVYVYLTSRKLFKKKKNLTKNIQIKPMDLTTNITRGAGARWTY